MSDQLRKSPEAWTRNLLLGSVVLNVFLAGFLFAKVIGPDTGDQASEPLHFTLQSLPQDLPVELQEQLENSFQLHSREMEKFYGEMLNARLRVQEIMNEENLNERALNEAMAEIGELQIKIQVPMRAAFIEAAKDWDANTRREFTMWSDSFDGRGLWNPRRVDGARWRVEFEDGEFIIDFRGFGDSEDGRGEE